MCAPFGILLGHVVCKEGMWMDLTNIDIIVNLHPPKLVKQFRTTLGNISYYRKFIQGYTEITALMENLLKKDVNF